MQDDDIQEGGDPAEAFEELRGEVALVRRAVERLSAERAELPEPVDYSETLGRMSNTITAIAQRVDTLAKGWAEAVTPDHIANRIVAASSDARRNDQQIIAEARSGLDQATRQIAGVVASARRGEEQNRWLTGVGAGGTIVGMVLWAALAGPIARTMPERWQWPERIAARTVNLPMWQAGQRLMASASPTSWRSIVAGDQIIAANREVIEGCRKAAAKARDTMRCTIRVGQNRDRNR